MTPRDTLEAVRARGIRLVARGDKLHVSAPPGALDEALRAALEQNKPALLQLLAGPRLEDDLPAEHCRACGSPNWWTSDERPGWHCSACEPRPDSFNHDSTGRVVIVAAGRWGMH